MSSKKTLFRSFDKTFHCDLMNNEWYLDELYTKFSRTLDEIEITRLSNELLRFIILIKDCQNGALPRFLK